MITPPNDYSIHGFREDDLSVLRSNYLFRQMADSDLLRVVSVLNGSLKSYDRGQLLHHAGTVMKQFGLVLSGMVQACIDDIEGNRMIMVEVTPGITFGESLCFLRVEDSPVYIYATEPVRVLWLSVEPMFTGTQPLSRDLQKRFTSVLAMRNLSMNNRIQVLSKPKLRDRLITYFSQLASVQNSDIIRLPLNRNDMATYIGSNRSALSRELSAMKRDGYIDFHRNTIRLLQMQRTDHLF